MAELVPAPATGSPTTDISDDTPELSSLAFLHWKVELQNKLIVSQEKRHAEERKTYKANEDAKFWERKQALHRKTSADFGNSKDIVRDMHADNIARGNEYKKELEQFKQLVMHEREEWAQFGHELTIQHGTEQAERTKARLAETADMKAEMGRQVRKEEQDWDKQIATQRHTFLVNAKEHVTDLKRDKIGKTDDAMRYALTQRKNKVASVQRTERKWKSLTKQEVRRATEAGTLHRAFLAVPFSLCLSRYGPSAEAPAVRSLVRQRDNFLGHAHDNHLKNDSCKEQMRTARKELVRRNNQTAREERERKEEDAAIIIEKKTQFGKAKRTARDKVFAERSISPDQMALYRRLSRSPSPEKAARDAGFIMPLPESGPSPYRLP